MLEPSNAVFHIPNSGLVWAFIVTCGDWLSRDLSDPLALAEQYQGVLECIRGVTEKLRARELNIDCVQLIIKDLKKFEQLLDNEPEKIQERLKMPSYEVTLNIKAKDELETADQVEKDSPEVEQIGFSVPEIVEVVQSRPKLMKKISSKHFWSLESSDHYGFSDNDSDSDEEILENIKEKDESQPNCSRLKSFRPTSCSIQLGTCNTRRKIVSSRPQVVAKYQ